MPRSRRRLRERSGALSIEQYDELVLGPGMVDPFTRFRDIEAREEAWFAHREEILAEMSAGARPWAWWHYESGLGSPPPAPVDRGGYEAWPRESVEVAWLRGQGLLTPFEEAELAKQKRLREVQAPARVADPEDAS